MKNNLSDLAYKYANDNRSFHTDNPVSLKAEIIERELRELRKKDCESVLNIFPKQHLSRESKAICNLTKACIEDYYAKQNN